MSDSGLLVGLSTIALLGTQRRPFSSEFLTELTGSLNGSTLQRALMEVQSTARSSEEALALCAALINRYERAGFEPRMDLFPPLVRSSGVGSGLGGNSEPDREPPSPSATQLLDLLLSGSVAVADKRVELIERWLDGCARHNKRVDYRQIVPLLEQATTHTALRLAAAAVVGYRGTLVASKNPTWTWVAKTQGVHASSRASEDRGARLSPAGSEADGVEEAPVNGFTADQLGVLVGEARVAMLRRWRSINASAALAVVRTNWASESAAERVALLDALSVGLSTDDESFLESLLDDKAKTVRSAALKLLASLPQTEWRNRMYARIQKVLVVKLGVFRKSVEFELPEEVEFDAAWIRDGLQVKGKSSSALGARAFALNNLVATAPLELWTSVSNRSASELLDHAAKSDLSDVIVAGWVSAAVVQQDGDWILALLDSGRATEMTAQLALALDRSTLDDFLFRALTSRQDVRTLFSVLSQTNSLSDRTANALLSRCEKQPKEVPMIEYLLPRLCAEGSSQTLDRLVRLLPNTEQAVRHLKAAQSLREAIDKEFP